MADAESVDRTIEATWASFVYRQRMSRGMSVREFARRAKVDPSYVSRVEVEGVIPSREVVFRFAGVMEINRDVVMLYAGYAPLGVEAMRTALAAIEAEAEEASNK